MESTAGFSFLPVRSLPARGYVRSSNVNIFLNEMIVNKLLNFPHISFKMLQNSFICFIYVKLDLKPIKANKKMCYNNNILL